MLIKAIWVVFSMRRSSVECTLFFSIKRKSRKKSEKKNHNNNKRKSVCVFIFYLIHTYIDKYIENNAKLI